ncbi:hypothetical protein T4B_8332 [Trichinella pseudospiralis]|uniref:Uncharacterized protein n=1 Tax=Trichinella pseudospiralis TaxID=6337 RepID=A0A0V1IPW7_TRIPS|nr:hypothetical protein T4A_2468 [Trichinella pseudospiralis]KRZ24229.1 hypothetical protein T4B_8332 [Trichinella pseudospiralis]
MFEYYHVHRLLTTVYRFLIASLINTIKFVDRSDIKIQHINRYGHFDFLFTVIELQSLMQIRLFEKWKNYV